MNAHLCHKHASLTSKHYAFATFVSLCAFANATQADVVASFSFDSLEAQYHTLSPTTGTFTATGVDQLGLRTVGDFARNVAPGGNADFAQGQVNIVMSLAINRAGNTFATAAGTFTITDMDGDTCSTTMTCDLYSLSPGIYSFAVSSPSLVQFTTDDGYFNGSNGSWIIDGTMTSASANILLLGFSAPGFFDQAFSTPLAVSGQLIPTPFAAPFLLATTFIFTRSRRR